MSRTFLDLAHSYQNMSGARQIFTSNNIAWCREDCSFLW